MHGRVLALGLLLMSPGTHAQAQASDEGLAVVETQGEAASALAGLAPRLGAAAQYLDEERLVEAEAELAAIIADARFAKLEPGMRHATLMMGGFAAMGIGQAAHARERFTAAIALDPDDSESRTWLFALEADLGNTEAAASHLIRLARQWPERLEMLEVGSIGRFVHGMDFKAASRLEVLQALFDSGWTHSGLGASALWYELAVMRIDRGEAQGARAAVARVTGPLELIKLISDKRFDSIVDPRAPEFDIERAARRNVDELRVLALLNPTRLDAEMELGYAMLVAGMHDEVITTADGILAAIEQSAPDDGAFEDLEHKIWIMNHRAIALRRLGRHDEALATLQRASKLSEEGQANVSQALNLGTFHCDFGRPDEALDAISVLGGMSGYGRMVQARIQQCAALLKGDHPTAEQALAYLRQHRSDSASILMRALLHAGRMDEAAQLLIEELDAPESRGEALLGIQQYQTPVATPGQREIDARRKELLARTDVLASIAKVGRTGRFAIQPLDIGW